MKACITILAVACAMAASSASAQTVAVGVNAGTPGLGLQATAKIRDSLVVRGAIDGMSVSRDETYSDISYDGKAKQQTVGLFADLHPRGGGFFVSGGFYAGKREIDLRAAPSANVEIGGATFTPAQVGRIDGSAELSKFQPFLGVGFDNTYVGDRVWGFRAIAGVAFSKAPDVTLRATGGTLSGDPAFQERLRAEEADAREDAKDFRYFPIVQVGLTRRF